MSRKQILTLILDFAIVVCAVLCLYFLYKNMDAGAVRRITILTIIFAVLLLGICEAAWWSNPKKPKEKRNIDISTLVLLGEDDRPIHIWDLTGKVGLLIGKSSDDYQVDIDLADTDFQTYIDPEHAILNYHSSGWWIQDTSSRNGISIFRKGQELLPGSHTPAKLEAGDIICIAKYTRIAVN